ncbi:MAG TPA: alpha-L-fucosidase [Candidatus Avimonoglobus intestinipullorum]|uniref:alpha-L-fucosidase n=1 Tax=Candidatus Avimonoglobus intestinipullorum TaxID=2840699 RepID=A0A9D1S619_9FIRM|nr:alpha-L-fucosidase [Candidatus Avimonoglobus intestinipullorum]
MTSGEATFVATRVGTGETQEITLQIKEAVRTVSLTGLAAKGGSSLPGQGDDKPTGNLNVGTKYVTNWSVWTDYIYWSAVIPKDGIDYKVRMNYSALNPVDGAYVILKIKEILSTETGEDGGQQDDIIGDTIVEYHIPTPNTGSWGTYVKAYSTEVIGDAGKLEQNKRYRFELSRPQNSSAVNFDEIILMPADYDPDAKPEGPEAVTGVRTDAGTVDADGNASVNLYWNAYSGAQEYQIFIDNASEPAKIVDAQTRQVNIDGLTQHEVYKFTVKAKYGMMVHWGPSSAFGGEYTGRQVGKTEEESIPHYSRANFPPELIESGAAPSNDTYTTQGYAEWIMNYAKIPREIYMTAAEEELDAGQYDFKEWVRLAKESGMRYLTVITKHHDGFAIMDTNGVGYNIIDHSAGGRDVFGELVRECRRQGMGIGAYYSQALDWLNNGGLGGIPELSGNVYTLDAQEKYVNQVVIPHLQTLAVRYNVDDIWWDMGVNSTEEFRYRSMKCVQALPGGERMIFNGRLYSSFSGADAEDFSTPEQNVPGKPANGDGTDWEACMTTNINWGYAKYDNYWKTTEATLFRVINITSKGGNFLYNVGPHADGSLPQESTDRLLEVGEWLQANGESIYDTTPAPFTQRVPWGRITCKTDQDGNTTLYLIVTKRELITGSGSTTKVTVDGVTYETDNRGPFYTNNGGPDGTFDAMDEDVWRAAWPTDGNISLPQMFNDAGEITSVSWLDPAQNTLGQLSVGNDPENGNIVISGLPAATVTGGAVNEAGNQYTSDQVDVPGLEADDYAAVIKLTLNGAPNMVQPPKPILPDENGDITLNAADAGHLEGNVSLSNNGPGGIPILGNFGAGGNLAQWAMVEIPETATYKVKAYYQSPNNTNISYITFTAAPEDGSASRGFEGTMIRVAAPAYGTNYLQTGGTADQSSGIMVGAQDATITLPAGRYTIELKRGVTGNIGTWFNLANLVLEKQE